MPSELSEIMNNCLWKSNFSWFSNKFIKMLLVILEIFPTASFLVITFLKINANVGWICVIVGSLCVNIWLTNNFHMCHLCYMLNIGDYMCEDVIICVKMCFSCVYMVGLMWRLVMSNIVDWIDRLIEVVEKICCYICWTDILCDELYCCG